MKTVVAVLSIMTGIFSTQSCRKPSQCSSCFPGDALHIAVSYKSPLNNIDLPDTRVITSTDSIMRIGLSGVSSRDYSKLNESLNLLTGETYQTIQSVFFINGLIENGKAFTNDQVQAVARISRAGKNMLGFSFYLKRENGFSKISEVSTNITVLTGNSLEALFKYLVFPGQTKNSILQVADRDNDDFVPKNHVDILMRKIQKAQQSHSSSLVLPDESDVCNRTFCPLVNDGNICEYRNRNYICYIRRSCFASYLKDYIISNTSMSSDSVSVAYDSSLHYRIRDSILSFTDFGRKYKNYYRDLSIVYGADTDPSIALKTVRLLYEMTPFFSSLRNYTTQGSQVFLNSTMKAKITDLITEFQSVYNDDFTEQVFQDILTDLAWVENKQISQVIGQFR